MRQSGSDIRHYACWALGETIQADGADTADTRGSDRGSHFGIASSRCESQSIASGVGAHNIRGLRDKFRRFAEWAFGPQGLASLEVIAYGDFAYDGRAGTRNLLLCRSTKGRGNFQLLTEYNNK